MYFVDMLSTSENLSAGEYGIKITHSCYGIHVIQIKSADGDETLQIMVEKDEDPEGSLVELDNQVLNLKREVVQLEDKVKLPN